MNRIAIDIARAITPPSLFGTDRRTAYANRKYHSGWIRTGVTSGFAGVKLSGSLRIYGSFSVSIVSDIIVIINPRIFLHTTNGKIWGTCGTNAERRNAYRVSGNPKKKNSTW